MHQWFPSSTISHQEKSIQLEEQGANIHLGVAWVVSSVAHHKFNLKRQVNPHVEIMSERWFHR